MATATYDSVSKAFNNDGSVPEDGLCLVIEEAKRTAKVNREASINEGGSVDSQRSAEGNGIK
jgi:hypothetical protein